MCNEEWALYLWLKERMGGREARKRTKDEGERKGGERRGKEEE